MKPFDFLNIFFEKKAIPSREEIDKDCNQYILNKTFSCDQNLVSLAHEMSKIKVTNKMYFDCMYYGLPRMKKFIKYNAGKAEKIQNIQYLMEYYGCSEQVAKEYSFLISDDEMKQIKDAYEKRGTR